MTGFLQISRSIDFKVWTRSFDPSLYQCRTECRHLRIDLVRIWLIRLSYHRWNATIYLWNYSMRCSGRIWTNSRDDRRYYTNWTAYCWWSASLPVRFSDSSICSLRSRSASNVKSRSSVALRCSAFCCTAFACCIVRISKNTGKRKAEMQLVNKCFNCLECTLTVCYT